MSLANQTLEAAALEALIDGDSALARELVDQLRPEEAKVVYSAAGSLATLAGYVAYAAPSERRLGSV